MPERYEKMRDKFMRDGLSRYEAQEKAAKIYNATKKKGEPAVNASETRFPEADKNGKAGQFPETDKNGYPKAGHDMETKSGHSMKMPDTRKRKGVGAAMKATVDSTGE